MIVGLQSSVLTYQRVAVRLAAVLLASCHAMALAQDSQEQVAAAPPPTSAAAARVQAAHVRLDEALVVACSSTGAVAVVFDEPDAPVLRTAVLRYRWRATGEQAAGEGAVDADSREHVLTVPHVRLSVKLMSRRGTVFYDPETVCVHPVKREFFPEQTGRDLGPGPRQTVDLQHFFQPDRQVQQWFRTRKYAGQMDEPGYPRIPLVFKVRYQENGLVVANPDGVAVFEFLNPFIRRSRNDVHRGVAYRWRFISADLDADQQGEGEVWELYRDNQYVNAETRHYLEAGQVHIPWSQNNADAGWIYFDPAWHGVWLVSPTSASNLVTATTQKSELSAFRFGPRPLMK